MTARERDEYDGAGRIAALPASPAVEPERHMRGAGLLIVLALLPWLGIGVGVNLAIGLLQAAPDRVAALAPQPALLPGHCVGDAQWRL